MPAAAEKVAALAGAVRRADPRIGGLQVLTGTSFLYHSDPRKLGRDVNPDDAADKNIYDDGMEIRYLLKSARRKPYLLDLDRAAGMLTLSEPALKGTPEERGHAAHRLRAGEGRAAPWTEDRLLVLLASLLAFYFLQKKLFRWRWPLAGFFLLLALAAGSLLMLANDRRNLRQARERQAGPPGRRRRRPGPRGPRPPPRLRRRPEGRVVQRHAGRVADGALLSPPAQGGPRGADRVSLGAAGAIALDADAAARAGKRAAGRRGS